MQNFFAILRKQLLISKIYKDKVKSYISNFLIFKTDIIQSQDNKIKCYEMKIRKGSVQL